MTYNPRHALDDCFVHLAKRLDPIIARTLAPHLGGLPWTTILSELDLMKGFNTKHYAATDPQSQLRVLTEKLGALGYPFSDKHRIVSTLAQELRIMRNRWAHPEIHLAALDAWRTCDFAYRLLDHFGDAEGVTGIERMRDQALVAVVDEKGIVGHFAPADDRPAALSEAANEEVVEPNPEVLARTNASTTPVIGGVRWEFEPWSVVVIGESSVLDELPRKVAKEQIRAIAVEIAAFEGPIEVKRLARLVAASFGRQKLWPAPLKKLIYQIQQTGLVVDSDKFVWPSDVDPATWCEFRPNSSAVPRGFSEISPVEIANAMRFIKEKHPEYSEAELDRATIQTFGRKKLTRGFGEHLAKAKKLV